MKFVEYYICFLVVAGAAILIQVSGSRLISVQLVSPPAYSGYNLAVVLPSGLYRITEHSGQYRLQLAHGIKSELLSLAFRPSHLYSYLFRGIF